MGVGNRTPKLETYRTMDPQLERTRRAVEVWAGRAECNPFLTGNIIPGIVLAIGANVIQHKLDKVPVGWFALDNQSIGVPVLVRTTWDNRTITINSTAIATVTLWVF